MEPLPLRMNFQILRECAVSDSVFFGVFCYVKVIYSFKSLSDSSNSPTSPLLFARAEFDSSFNFMKLFVNSKLVVIRHKRLDTRDISPNSRKH